ncbi:MAG: hypothetical protein WCR06_10575 [bacterium]
MNKWIALLVAGLAVGAAQAGTNEDRELVYRCIPEARYVAAMESQVAIQTAMWKIANSNATQEAVAAYRAQCAQFGLAREAQAIRSFRLAGADAAACLNYLVTGNVAEIKPRLTSDVIPDLVSYSAGGVVASADQLTKQRINALYVALILNEEPFGDGTLKANYTQYCLALYQRQWNRVYLQQLLAGIQAKVRRTLREAGRSIVTVNGVNPVEAAMKPLIAASNAPLLDGMEQACAAFGVTVTVDRSEDLIAKLKQLKESAWYGDIQAVTVAGQLQFLMGTEGYNAWVVRFNAK